VPRGITNFGGNVRFTPAHFYAPTTEAEVLAILDRHPRGKFRVCGALHSWNAGVVSADAVVDLRHFNSVEVKYGANGEAWTVVGGGCRIKHLLRKLHADSRVTLPSLGLITEQTIAGAISTATHGSGRHSMSHYVDEVRLAAYDPDTGRARLVTISGGDELRAARCALGCMGIILSVRIRCVPRYDVVETIVPCDTLDEVLKYEAAYPLQQFYLLPHRWTYLAQRRHLSTKLHPRRSWPAILYRCWWLLGIDVGLHLILLFLAGVVKRPAWTRFFFRRVMPKLIVKNWTAVDRGERMLVMEHELFRHLEIELFVPTRHLHEAAHFVRFVVDWFDGSDPQYEEEIARSLRQHGFEEEFERLRGAYTHHYPITFRRVLPDDTLLSPSSGDHEPHYAISFISYADERGPFFAFASFLGRSMAVLHRARPHWGKWLPEAVDVDDLYPRLPEFRALCRGYDPHGVFRTPFIERLLFHGR
jgi:FAD/FMN-containing dehydrogenase